MSEGEFVDAAACGDLAGVSTLLESKDLSADVINKVDKDGRTAFHYACLNDDVPLLTILLAEPRVDVCKVSPKGDTGLHMSSLYAALEAMALLKADGRIALDAQNNYGETPLHLCAGSGDKGASKAASLLLDWGASLTITDKWKRGPLDVSRDNGENPLMATFQQYLNKNENENKKKEVDEITAAYKSK
jgi:ankyrin repeat protein